MYCPKCNTCYMDDGKFCQECGAPLIQNAVYSEKKRFPVKIILAVAALSLSLVAGYSLYKKDGPAQAGKAQDVGLPSSEVQFTAGNSMTGKDVKRHARRASRNNLVRDDSAASSMAASPASSASAPAAASVSGGKAGAGRAAPKDVGTPRAVNTGVQVAGGGNAFFTSGRDSADKKTAGRQQMVVIRDPLQAETRN